MIFLQIIFVLFLMCRETKGCFRDMMNIKGGYCLNGNLCRNSSQYMQTHTVWTLLCVQHLKEYSRLNTSFVAKCWLWKWMGPINKYSLFQNYNHNEWKSYVQFYIFIAMITKCHKHKNYKTTVIDDRMKKE